MAKFIINKNIDKAIRGAERSHIVKDNWIEESFVGSLDGYRRDYWSRESKEVKAFALRNSRILVSNRDSYILVKNLFTEEKIECELSVTGEDVLEFVELLDSQDGINAQNKKQEEQEALERELEEERNNLANKMKSLYEKISNIICHPVKAEINGKEGWIREVSPCIYCIDGEDKILSLQMQLWTEKSGSCYNDRYMPVINIGEDDVSIKGKYSSWFDNHEDFIGWLVGLYKQ